MKAGELKTIIDKIQEKEEIAFYDVAGKVKMDRSYLSKIVNGNSEKVMTAGLIRKFRSKFPAYFPEPIQNNTLSREKTTESHKIPQEDATSQLLADLVHTNRNLSESNKSLALSHEELVGMVKKDSTSDEARYTMEETVALVMGLREYLAEIAAYVKKMPPHEALQEIHSKVKVARAKAGKKGSPIVVSK